ncbi:mechanosensitive ion channel family protein [Thiomicrorhabdus aquaedulcis]|uniref:mechanosensitive ion channel family protein n=1 Tax=Thiomicrorhabdus aquaedulcis TaxID=2211106 RepID=UPI000FD6C1CD|nr:mechanosensitive ion channel family protein [Thiomicrorhabdus aquaedulcis]
MLAFQNQFIVDYLQDPLVNMVLGVVLLIFVAWLANYIVKRVLLRGLYTLLGNHAPQPHNGHKLDFSFIDRLSHVVPALIISTGVSRIPELPNVIVVVTENVTNAFMVVTVGLVFTSLLTLFNGLYERKPESKNKPIKGYIQVLNIIIYLIAIILMIAVLFDRSPLILLSGLGAMAAVLMLIFQDTILSLVASVQISSNDVIRVGDWVEMPDLNADGDVIDIALHTVKIQNWDKTITTIPTRRFMTDSFKNWRGMQESGGRRIKRSLMFDQQTIHFLDASEITWLKKINLLKDYMAHKEQEVAQWNTALEQKALEPVNFRRLTNIGTFRAYVMCYLQQHPKIHQGMTQIVRQMSPTAEGLPIEIYCFTDTVVWAEYEAIQSDIFDHLYSIAPEFGLRVFQSPSGYDLMQLAKTVMPKGAVDAV